MLRKTIQTRMLVVLFVVTTFASATLSGLSQEASPVAPAKAQVEAVVREAYDKFHSDTSGKNADYIPFLAQVDSKMFGVAVVSTDNQVFSIGEVNYAFSILSISKVYTLALAMEESSSGPGVGTDRQRADWPSFQFGERCGGDANAHCKSISEYRRHCNDQSDLPITGKRHLDAEV